MMVALEGQQSALETKAFWKVIPLSCKRERVLGMYLRSSFRMSSARMKTMLGLAVGAPASLGMLPATPKASSRAKAIAANAGTVFLTLTILLRGRRKEQDSAPAMRERSIPYWHAERILR